MKFELVSVIVDLIHDHTYLAWGTFWRRSNRTGYGRRFSSSGFGASYFDFWFTLLIKDIYDSYDFSPKKKRKRKKISLFQNLNHHKLLTDLRYRFYYGISFAKTNSTVFLFPQLFFWEIVFLRNTFLNCYCNTPIWLIVWCMWVCNKSHIGYLLGRSGLY